MLYRISQIETESQQSIYFGANIDHRLHGWVKGFGFFWSWISRMGFDHGLHGCVKGFDFLFALDFTEEEFEIELEEDMDEADLDDDDLVLDTDDETEDDAEEDDL